jgi:hypothetical protein
LEETPSVSGVLRGSLPICDVPLAVWEVSFVVWEPTLVLWELTWKLKKRKSNVVIKEVFLIIIFKKL